MRQVLKLQSIKLGARVVVPLVVLGFCLMLLSQKLTPEFWKTLPATLASVSPLVWFGAAAMTAVSFWAVGRYDGVAHRHLGTGVPQNQARLSGTIAIGVAQTLGFGLLTGALVRWRLLPQLSLARALGLSAFVSGSFIAGWAFVTALVCLVLPAPAWSFWPALAIVLATPAFGYCLFRWPVLRLSSFSVGLPSLRMSGAILVWSAVDMVAAAAALWLLLPASAEVSFAAFVPIYMIALGAALISNTPGGVGPFELVLIGAMPHVSTDALILSVICFRLVYYALPACLGMVALIRPLVPREEIGAYPLPSLVLRQAPRSEVGVILQNNGYMARTRDGAAALWTTGQTVTALFDPIRGRIENTMSKLVKEAQAQGRWPLLYKCCSTSAVVARAKGWSVLHIADDALIDTRTYRLDVPERRTLRRKLRGIEKAGVHVLPLGDATQSELAEIDANWVSRCGPARGGTMGRYCPHYIDSQTGFVARANGRAVAFVTFFNSQHEWALDLMRQTDDAPTGVMHALVHAAIEAAGIQAVPTVSLAATPACPDPSSALWRAVSMRVVSHAGGPGLRQFKSAFAPTWRPRYAAAQGPVSLALGLADIAREVHFPRPVSGEIFDDVQHLHEIYELDSRHSA